MVLSKLRRKVFYSCAGVLLEFSDRTEGLDLGTGNLSIECKSLPGKGVTNRMNSFMKWNVKGKKTVKVDLATLESIEKSLDDTVTLFTTESGKTNSMILRFPNSEALQSFMDILTYLFNLTIFENGKYAFQDQISDVFLDEEKDYSVDMDEFIGGSITERVVDDYIVLDGGTKEKELQEIKIYDKLPVVHVARGERVSSSTWINIQDTEGRIMGEGYSEFLQQIIEGGIDEDLRHVVWPFLLKWFSTNSSEMEREGLREEAEEEYIMIKSQWQSVTPNQEKRFSHFRSLKARIRNDLIRTVNIRNEQTADTAFNILMTYSFFNFDLGYEQGMGDVLIPVLRGFEEEFMSFKIFSLILDNHLAESFGEGRKGLFDKIKNLQLLVETSNPNLYRSMHIENLYSTYRWFYLLFSREYPEEDLFVLWDAIFSHDIPELFIVCVAGVMLMLHAKTIIERNLGEEIINFINDLAYRFDVGTSINSAHNLYLIYEKKWNNVKKTIEFDE